MKKPRCDILIRNGIVFTVDDRRTVHAPGAVAIAGTRVVAVGEDAALARDYAAIRAIDAGGGVIHPGLIDAHLHVTAHLSRGIIDHSPVSGARAYAAWFNGITDEDEHANAMAASAEMLRNGVTCFMEAGTAYSTEVVAEAVSAVGIRASLTDPFVWDLPNDANPLATLVERMRPDRDEALARLGIEAGRRRPAEGLLHGHVGLYGSCSATAELECAAKACAREHRTVLCQHQNFSPAQVAADDERFAGEGAIAAFARLGVLDAHTTLVHMNCLRDAEAEALLSHRPNLVWQPANYLIYGVSRSCRTRLPELRRAGLAVALGSDVPKAWTYGDMGAVARLLAGEQGAPVDAHGLLDMQTADAARALGLESEIGSIAPGHRADLVIRDPATVEDAPGFDPLLHALLISRGRSVRTVIVNGAEVVRDGVLVRVDESRVRDTAHRSAARLAARIGVTPRVPIITVST